MMSNAVLILVLGMGGVFIFLLALIMVMTFIARLLPPGVQELQGPGSKKSSKAVAAQKPGNEQLIAVLQAAVHAYETDVQLNKV